MSGGVGGRGLATPSYPIIQFINDIILQPAACIRLFAFRDVNGEDVIICCEGRPTAAAASCSAGGAWFRHSCVIQDKVLKRKTEQNKD